MFDEKTQIVIDDENETHVLLTIYKNGKRVGDIGGTCVDKKEFKAYLKRLSPGRVMYIINNLGER